MDAHVFLDIVESLGDKFYAGVPDSLLSPIIDAVMERYGIGENHIVTANEGGAVGLAAGHYLATARPGIVYMQNSGLGNAINPICSLLHKKVFAIPVVFIIGWRGEPGTKDEPQHVFQGEVTIPILNCLGIPYQVFRLGEDIDTNKFRRHIANGQSVAFVICKDAILNNNKMNYATKNSISRERALEVILSSKWHKNDIFVCTTGKLSREVFEIRNKRNEGHERDFLNCGAMGHSLMIAFGLALAKPERRIWCLDGDGSVLMHMGGMAIIGFHRPENLVHVVINNSAHESVGGLPTVGKNRLFRAIASAVGYNRVYSATTYEELDDILINIKNESVFIEIMCNLSVRENLGRPSAAPIENKKELRMFLSAERN